MWVRIIAIVVAALGLVASAVTFDASGAASQAMSLASSSVSQSGAAPRAAMVKRGAEVLDQAWSQPLRWHPGAMEARSWLSTLEAEAHGEDISQFRISRFYAEASAAHSPLQPYPWLRLAMLELHGERNALCDAKTCLDRSWRANVFMEPGVACERLHVALQAGVTFDADDPRLIAYGATRPRPRAMSECLDFLPPDVVYSLLIARHRIRARQEARGVEPSRAETVDAP